MKLRDYLGYMRTASASSDSEPPLVVYDSSFLDSPGLSNTDYRPGSMGDEGGDTFYHHSRYPWSGPGALTDAMNAISDRDTARWPHFFVGPRNAGGGFQTRCSLFTSVTDGQQLFMAYPPSQPGFGSAISREHPLEWLRNVNQQSPEILQGFAGLPRYANPLVRAVLHVACRLRVLLPTERKTRRRQLPVYEWEGAWPSRFCLQFSCLLWSDLTCA